MHLYRFIEGDLYEDGTREFWCTHPQEMTDKQVVSSLVKAWADLRTTAEGSEELISKEKLFTEAGFTRVKPTTSVHLGNQYWLTEFTVSYMNSVIMGIGNRTVPEWA